MTDIRRSVQSAGNASSIETDRRENREQGRIEVLRGRNNLCGRQNEFPDREQERIEVLMGRNRKVREQRGRMLILAVLLTSALIVSGILCRGQETRAAGSYQTVTRYKSIEISRGDTLWEIAGEYGVGQDRQSYIREVMRMNHLEDDTIHAGAYLMVPYFQEVPLH